MCLIFGINDLKVNFTHFPHMDYVIDKIIFLKKSVCFYETNGSIDYLKLCENIL